MYILLAYLLGSIPFGWLVARFWQVDIRRHGSGNIGATNVFRTLGPLAGGLVFALDFLKGWLAVYLGYWLGGDPVFVLLLGFGAILGHMFSIFLGFKGGKGAATGLGVLAGLAPDIFIIAMVMAIILITTTRYVSVASMVTALAATIMMFVFNKPLPFTLLVALVTAFIIIRHRTNIARLLAGTENKVGRKNG